MAVSSKPADRTSPPEPSPPTKPQHRSQAKWLGPLVLLGPSGLWLLLLLVFPTLVIFELSLVPDIRPGELVNPSGFDNYLRVFNSVNLQVMGKSLFFATGTMLICLFLGFPVAYNIALKVPKQWQNLVLLGFVLPLWTSSLLRSYAWVTILEGETGVLDTFVTSLGLSPLGLLNQPVAVMIGMSYSFLPYMVLILYATLEKLDRRVLEASADLGATPFQTFWKITIPMSFQGIVAGSLLVFISALGDFVDPEILGGASSMTITRLIYNQFLGPTQNWGFGSALSVILILLVSIAIALLIRFGDSRVQKS